MFVLLTSSNHKLCAWSDLDNNLKISTLQNNFVKKYGWKWIFIFLKVTLALFFCCFNVLCFLVVCWEAISSVTWPLARLSCLKLQISVRVKAGNLSEALCPAALQRVHGTRSSNIHQPPLGQGRGERSGRVLVRAGKTLLRDGLTAGTLAAGGRSKPAQDAIYGAFKVISV